MTQPQPRPLIGYENYPGPPIPAASQPRRAGGVGRGSVAGMATAAMTMVGTPPLRFAPDLPWVAYAVAMTMYTVIAALIGALPGAVAGGLASALARAGASPLALRAAGGLAAAAAATLVNASLATLVNASLALLSWPGLVIATLCGAVAAPWVAWGRRGPTLE